MKLKNVDHREDVALALDQVSEMVRKGHNFGDLTCDGIEYGDFDVTGTED